MSSVSLMLGELVLWFMSCICVSTHCLKIIMYYTWKFHAHTKNIYNRASIYVSSAMKL